MGEQRVIGQAEGRALSFAYARPADRAELLVLETLLAHEPLNAGRDGREMGWALLQGLGALLVLGPVVYILVFLLDFSGVLKLNTPEFWQFFTFGWFVTAFCIGLGRVVKNRALMALKRRALEADLSQGEVIEEAWRFVETIAFQEAEKMPYHYGLHADNDCVIMLHETNLRSNHEGYGPFAASVAPADAVFVRAPRSGALLSESYSGPVLPVLEVYPLPVPPDQRPQHGAIIKAKWDDLPALFGGRAGRLL